MLISSNKLTTTYTYLGQTITSNGKCDDEIVKRIEIARGAFNSIFKTITARHIIMKTRKRIIKAYVWSALGVDDKHHRMDGDAIRRPRETCSRSGAMEDHDSQPSQSTRLMATIQY